MLDFCIEEEFEDTKGVIGIRISKKNRQKTMAKRKSTNFSKTYYHIHITKD